MLFLLTLLLGCGAAGRATSWEPTINQVVWKGDVKRLILLVETSTGLSTHRTPAKSTTECSMGKTTRDWAVSVAPAIS